MTQKLHDKAEEFGYMCAWVSVSLEKGEEKVCNAFKTADKGLFLWIIPMGIV